MACVDDEAGCCLCTMSLIHSFIHSFWDLYGASSRRIGRCVFLFFLLLQTGGNCSPPVSVTSVIVTDPDRNNCLPYVESLSCSVISGPGSQFFDIVNCLTVRNNVSIDADSYPFYENIDLLIESRDSGNLTTFATIHISVININDYSPNFTQPEYNGSVLGEYRLHHKIRLAYKCKD